MVRVISDIPSKLYGKILEIIEAGHYDGLTQFILAACDNQVAMHSKAIESIEQSLASASEPCEIPEPSPKSKSRKSSKESKSKKTSSKKKPEITLDPSSIQSALHFFKMPSSQPSSLLEPMKEYIDEWPWGQTNRYLPLKMVVRAIVNLYSDGSWPNLWDVMESLKEPSAIIGSMLTDSDRKLKRIREDALATALPRVDSEKSQERFVKSFLSAITPTGLFYPGGAFFYGFTRWNEDRSVGLTTNGMVFCRLINPILDGSDFAGSNTLSPEEIEFLSSHALELPGESHAFSTIKKALDNRMNLSPTEFSESVASLLGEDPESGGFRMKFSGVLSRMIELRLICRKWQGTRAFYSSNKD